MLQLIETINNAVNNFIWGVPAMICIFGVGLYLSLRTRFLQIRKFPYAIRTTLGRMFRKRDASDGAITPFQAVCTALAATVGTGNIAGVAGAIAIGGPGAVFWMWVSALLGIPVRHDVAMTGEVTLRGRVLPIGGLKEKSMAAYIRGIKTVIIPKANVPDLDEVDDAVKANVEFVPVSHVDEVLSVALLPVSKPAEVVDAHDDSKDSKHADIPAHDKTGGRRSRVTQ